MFEKGNGTYGVGITCVPRHPLVVDRFVLFHCSWLVFDLYQRYKRWSFAGLRTYESNMVVAFFPKLVHVHEVVLRQLQDNGQQDEEFLDHGVVDKLLKGGDFFLVSCDESMPGDIGTRSELVDINLDENGELSDLL